MQLNNFLLKIMTFTMMDKNLNKSHRFNDITWVPGALSKRSPRIVELSGASANAERPRHPKSIQIDSVILSLLFMLGAISISGCGYAKVGPKAYECSMALYSVCNRRDESRLNTIAELVETSFEEDELTATEAKYLNAIIDKARKGEWEQATSDARSLLKDQVD